jgi:hypothetical protein
MPKLSSLVEWEGIMDKMKPRRQNNPTNAPQSKEKRQLMVLLMVLLISGIGIGAGVVKLAESYSTRNILGKVFPENCSGLDLIKTANCLQGKLIDFYYYNITNTGKELTFEQLKEQGGVCSHYSEWYSNQAEQLGFNADKVIFQYSPTERHEISIISDSTGYCTMDQLNVNCVGFAE